MWYQAFSLCGPGFNIGTDALPKEPAFQPARFYSRAAKWLPPHAAVNKQENRMRRLISSGSSFELEIGYSRAVVDGDWIFVAGTTGFDYGNMTISGDVVAQAEQCMRNIEQALTEAGGDLADIVRVHYILPRRNDFKPCWPVLRKYFGEIRPAATMIEAGLSDPRMKIEIEVTARHNNGTE
jgi:enamine deaminase RidA (YjgF/YER057c/UK114 family)